VSATPTVVAESAAPRPAPSAEPLTRAEEPAQSERSSAGQPDDSRDRAADSVARPKVPRPATEPSAADVNTGEPLRRRPVVFDEDDDLDVPDFLK
jgi:cell division protein FtsZ